MRDIIRSQQIPTRKIIQDFAPSDIKTRTPPRYINRFLREQYRVSESLDRAIQKLSNVSFLLLSYQESRKSIPVQGPFKNAASSASMPEYAC